MFLSVLFYPPAVSHLTNQSHQPLFVSSLVRLAGRNQIPPMTRMNQSIKVSGSRAFVAADLQARGRHRAHELPGLFVRVLGLGPRVDLHAPVGYVCIFACAVPTPRPPRWRHETVEQKRFTPPFELRFFAEQQLSAPQFCVAFDYSTSLSSVCPRPAHALCSGALSTPGRRPRFPLELDPFFQVRTDPFHLCLDAPLAALPLLLRRKG